MIAPAKLRAPGSFDGFQPGLTHVEPFPFINCSDVFLFKVFALETSRFLAFDYAILTAMQLLRQLRQLGKQSRFFLAPGFAGERQLIDLLVQSISLIRQLFDHRLIIDGSRSYRRCSARLGCLRQNRAPALAFQSEQNGAQVDNA